MAFNTAITPDEAYPRAKRLFRSVRKYCQQASSQVQSVVERPVVLQIRAQMLSFSAEASTLGSVPGIAAYAADQVQDPGYDVVAEYQATVAAMTAVVAEIDASFPVAAGTNHALVMFVDGTVDTFLPAQLATLKTLLDAVVASISP